MSEPYQAQPRRASEGLPRLLLSRAGYFCSFVPPARSPAGAGTAARRWTQHAARHSSLVHESYLRFAGAGRLRLQDRAHFMRWAARAMRSVIVDFARRRQALRRGGGQGKVTLTTGIVDVASGEAEILRVHSALEEMAARQAHGRDRGDAVTSRA
jgi:ECF sigma factor